MIEVPFTHDDGVNGAREVFAFPMHDDSGRAIGVVEYVRDITQRKQAEEAIFEREKLQGVLEMAGAVCHEMN
jgi:PAS domain-containing protein